mmetsp:Transcript_65365/g.156135  ORF Transcript_65365/g.156135 Transcript_65365/m.156135 type:complete len:212 (-) Transcript_65365:160-795(-)
MSIQVGASGGLQGRLPRLDGGEALEPPVQHPRHLPIKAFSRAGELLVVDHDGAVAGLLEGLDHGLGDPEHAQRHIGQALLDARVHQPARHAGGVELHVAGLLTPFVVAVGRCHHDGGIPYEAHHSRRALALVPVRLLQGVHVVNNFEGRIVVKGNAVGGHDHIAELCKRRTHCLHHSEHQFFEQEGPRLVETDPREVAQLPRLLHDALLHL